MRTGTGGRGLVIGDKQGNVVAWTVVDSDLKEQRVRAHDSEVVHASLLGDSEALITAARDGEISHWSLPLPSVRSFRSAESSSPVLASDAAGRWVAVRSGGKNVDVYRAKEGKPHRRFTIPGAGSSEAKVTSAAFSNDGEWLIAGDSAGQAHLFQIDQPKPAAKLDLGESAVNHLIPGSDEASPEACAFATADGVIGMLNMPTSAKSTPAPPGAYQLVQLTDDGQAMAGVDTRAGELHWIEKGNERRRKTAPLGPLAGDLPSAISISGRLVLVGTQAGKVAVLGYVQRPVQNPNHFRQFPFVCRLGFWA